MTNVFRSKFIIFLLIFALAVCACGVNSGAYVHTSAAVDLAPAWNPMPRYAVAAVQVDFQIEKYNGKVKPCCLEK